jgi:predicted ATPase
LYFFGITVLCLKKNVIRKGKKKRRRISEKIYKEKVNKKVDGERKRKQEKQHKGESRYRNSTNGKIKGQKEKREREELTGE